MNADGLRHDQQVGDPGSHWLPRLDDVLIKGDVDFDEAVVGAGAITPVPGGLAR